eukprot:14454919-Ditylum_brightwellii.AAC.1
MACKRKCDDNEVTVTNYRPKSIEYIMKQSGEFKKQHHSNHGSKRDKANVKKTKILEENKNYTGQADVPDIIFPDAVDMLI